MSAKWAHSLIRIAKHEVEILQKRVGEVTERRMACERRLEQMAEEQRREAAISRRDAEAGWYQAGYVQGFRAMRDRLLKQIEEIKIEEAGARDALGRAFEELKKFEHVAEVSRLADIKDQARRETAAMDELGLRKATGV